MLFPIPLQNLYIQIIYNKIYKNIIYNNIIYIKSICKCVINTTQDLTQNFPNNPEANFKLSAPDES